MPNFKSTGIFVLSLVVWASGGAWSQTTFDDEKFELVVAKMESTARELAREVERLHDARCVEETMTSCEAANYANCLSRYPNVTCPTGTIFQVKGCGNAEGCSSQYDFTVSSTRIPNDVANGAYGNPTDPRVSEALCFTRPLDDWFVRKRNEDLSFWQDLGIDGLPSMYFGSHTGAFRMYPARHTDDCNFDPRVRPWYVAASSGPKNIIMILDVSGSINEDRMYLLQLAAKRVVETLTVQDRIAIIPFESTARKIADPNGRMLRATAETIDYLSQQIDELVGGGETNFYDAFEAAFDVFDATVDEELHVSCNSALLFLTDGERTNGPETDEVTRLIQDRMASLQARLFDKPILLFTYSISQDEKIHEYPSQLACAVDLGVWSRISSDEEIIESLSSYYQLFALGLGSVTNEDFVTWVEPYEFFSSDVLGTTVSAPVYDRTKSPPLLLGVVAVDIPISALDAALGSDDNQDAAVVRNESIKRIVLTSRVRCPVLELEDCELESYRRDGNCSLNCTADQLVQVEEEACSGRPDYPTNYWANTDVADLDDESRICCRVDETSPSDMCQVSFDDPMSNTSTGDDDGGSFSAGDIIGIAGSVIGFLGICCFIYEVYFGFHFRNVYIFMILREKVGRPPLPPVKRLPPPDGPKTPADGQPQENTVMQGQPKTSDGSNPTLDEENSQEAMEGPNPESLKGKTVMQGQPTQDDPNLSDMNEEENEQKSERKRGRIG